MKGKNRRCEPEIGRKAEYAEEKRTIICVRRLDEYIL